MHLADLADFELGIARWDMVISIFSHPPSTIRRRLYRQLQQALRPRGCLVLENKVDKAATSADRYPGTQFLREEIAPLKIALAQEQERQLNEGHCHVGLQRTAQIVAAHS